MTVATGTSSRRQEGMMMREFATGRVRFVEHMTFLEVASFLGEGVGGALYVFGVIAASQSAKILGVAFVGFAIAALLAHLGRRALIAWRALARIGTSWVSRGTLFMGLFMAFAVSDLGVRLFTGLDFLAPALETAAAIIAVLVVIYAGMMLRSMKAVVLWHSLYLPLAFSAHSIASALLILSVLVAPTGELFAAAAASLIAAAVVSALYLASRPKTEAIKASLNRIVVGRFRLRMLWGAFALGILTPLVILGFTLVLGDNVGGLTLVFLLLLAALSRLYGDYAFRSAIVMSGAYEPIIPPVSRGLGKTFL